MGEAGRQSDLAQEAVGADLGGDLGTEDLDGDLAIVAEVVGQVDHGHAAFAKLSFDGVAAGERGCKTGLEVGHSGGKMAPAAAAR